MAFPLLIPIGIAIGALFIASRKAEKPKSTEPPATPPPSTPPIEQNMLMLGPNGVMMYKPEARPIILTALKVKTFQPTSNDRYFALYDFPYQGKLPETGKSAWWLAKGLRDVGKNIWVTPTFFDPVPQQRHLIYTDPGELPPKGANLALLVSFKDVWAEQQP